MSDEREGLDSKVEQYCLIDADGVVVDIVMWDGKEKWDYDKKKYKLKKDKGQIGWKEDKSTGVVEPPPLDPMNPPLPPPSTEEPGLPFVFTPPPTEDS